MRLCAMANMTRGKSTRGMSRLIDRLDVIGRDKLDDVRSTAANKESYEAS
jgi:hypothetical protein